MLQMISFMDKTCCFDSGFVLGVHGSGFFCNSAKVEIFAEIDLLPRSSVEFRETLYAKFCEIPNKIQHGIPDEILVLLL
jgi:hypothetical protein